MTATPPASEPPTAAGPSGPTVPPRRGPTWVMPAAMVGLVILPVTCCLGGLIGSNWVFSRYRAHFETVVLDRYRTHPVMVKQLGGLTRAHYEAEQSRLVQGERENDRLAAFSVAGPLGEGRLVLDLAAQPYGPEPTASVAPTLEFAGETFVLDRPDGPVASGGLPD